MKKLSFVFASLLALSSWLIPQRAAAITIDIRYDYDTTHFFDQPGAKDAIRAVANYYETLITDSLTAISPSGSNTWTVSFPHPATGATQTITNLAVPANTIIVYVGARTSIQPAAGQGGYGAWSANGTQAWLATVGGRGQSGALAKPATDFAPWGGSITFDPSLTWSFSTTGPVENTTPFVSIALHEFGHVFGIGTCPSWSAKISASNTFTGAAAVAVFGKPVPLQTGGFHWQDDGVCSGTDGYDPTNPLNVLSKAYGIFGTLHGYAQIALMDPFQCSAGPFLKTMTDLDLAALRDIGWQLAPPARWQSYQFAASPFTFSWPSTSGTTYRVESSTTLLNWSTLTTQAGNGSIQSFSAAAPANAATFYRLNTAPVALPASVAQPVEGYPTSQPPGAVPVCHASASFGTQD